MSELCHVCRRPIQPTAAVWMTIQTARQTHSSPAEYDEVPLHPWCLDGEERDEAYERAAARYDGSAKDWR